MTGQEALIFTLMVFVAIVLLATALIVPTAGTAAQSSRRMRKRIALHLENQEPGVTSMLREQYLNDFTPFESLVERLSVFESLSQSIEQSGTKVSVAKLLLKCTVFSMIAFIPIVLLTGSLIVALVVAMVVFAIPIINIIRKRAARLVRFEEQLPEALDIMSRALEAGHPFTETLNLVAEEMQDPIAGEFGRVFSDLNFGLPLKASLQGVLTRVPSMSLHTLVTAVLIQSESGGALAEILAKVAEVIRGRFKLQRKIKTLSAEGRMSAWILAMIPFILAAVLMVASPDYLPVLLQDELGKKFILIAFGLMVVGVFWIRNVIRIEV